MFYQTMFLISVFDPAGNNLFLEFIIEFWGNKRDLIFLEYSKELGMMFHWEDVFVQHLKGM